MKGMRLIQEKKPPHPPLDGLAGYRPASFACSDPFTSLK